MDNEQFRALLELLRLQETPEQVAAAENLAALLTFNQRTAAQHALANRNVGPVSDKDGGQQLKPIQYSGRFGHGGG